MTSDQVLSFDEIMQIIHAAEKLGVEKIRLTGGEPLLRRNIHQLISRIHSETGIKDIALTSNGLLLAKQARQLRECGLKRVNLSLDAVDPTVFAAMSGGYGHPDRVIDAMRSALDVGLKVKLNTVIKRGINENQIVPLLRLAMEFQVEIRFIEYMDVGASNGWERSQVFSESEILKMAEQTFGSVRSIPEDPLAVSRTYSLTEHGNYRWGIIASISRPFCGGCVRARVSSNGKLYTCLFSQHGYDLRGYLREGRQDQLLSALEQIWIRRDDRYSELRDSSSAHHERIEMSYIGG